MHTRSAPGLLFEVSWEVANKVGGIHTVLTGKAPLLLEQWGATYLAVGPYLAQSNREWTEDPTLFADWRAYFFREKGYAVHVGHWSVRGHRIPTLLIDFYPLLSQRNEIFATLWERYRVDSLAGGWDYIEPAIFGYSAGELVESFCRFYYEETPAIAHFHEWLTGAGVLYLHMHAPKIATVFTTHATVIGRAAEGQLVEEPLEWARARQIVSKHTLERAAWQAADATTTVSETISAEAAHYLGHAADVLTPNGWDPPTDLPVEVAKKWLRQLHVQWGGTEAPFWLIHAGRPELVNKGTLPLIEALRRYREAPVAGQRLQVIFAVPGDADGPAALSDSPLWVSHRLRKPHQDPLFTELRRLDLRPDDSLRIAYLPVYLEGQDGLVNVPYYALLAAMDASAFPSRYEPWGYTPQESLGLGVPTLSSRQAGFGQWMAAQDRPLSEALGLIDYHQPDPAGQILRWMYRHLGRSEAEREQLRAEALALANPTCWYHFLASYQRAYEVAHTKVQARLWYRLPGRQPTAEEPFRWHRAFFLPALPETLRPLRSLAYNLWWSWNPDAQALFAAINPQAWEKHENPVRLLNRLSSQQARALSTDEDFLRQLRQVLQRFQSYMGQSMRSDVPRVAYLCMEYGLSRCLPFYSGGLGVLAGDFLKEASDQRYPLIGIGLLYRKGYFTQRITPEGEQIAETPALRFTDLPLEPVRQSDGRWLRLQLPIADQVLYLKVWRVHVGRVPLYLLDSDVSENPPALRDITAQLYAGDAETRLQQEIVLGFGAQRLVEALALPIHLFHYNEGHPALHTLAYLAALRKAGHSLEEAKEEVRLHTLFTTHTPVPAGHDAFEPELVRKYLGAFIAQQLQVSWETVLSWALMPGEAERFSLTALALRLCGTTNAVSQLHARVSQRMFASFYPAYLPQEVPIRGVTNGVHAPTWQAPEWSRTKRNWETHQTLKKQLLAYLRRRLLPQPWPVEYLESLQAFLSSTDEHTLLLGFARRVATYKRHLLFFQHKGFAQLLESEPVRVLFAGKAHPKDDAGKAALRQLWERSLEPPFRGKVLFLPDYDMQLARYLVQGVDVWVNLPVYGQEASGTSGMKAALNGVLHLSIPDGWWAEVEADAAGGWNLPLCQNPDPQLRDSWEAVQLTYLIQESVLPAYRDRDPKGLPLDWIVRMEKAQRYVAERFSMQRMFREYEELLYGPIAERARRITEAERRQRMVLLTQIEAAWPAVRIHRLRVPPFEEQAYPASEPFSVEVEVDSAGLPADVLRAEVVFEGSEGEVVLFPLAPTEPDHYAGEICLTEAGVYHFAVRLYAWDPYLQERLWAWTKLF